MKVTAMKRSHQLGIVLIGGEHMQSLLFDITKPEGEDHTRELSAQ